MSTVEKIAMGIVGIALATTLILPGRQTASVIRAGGDVFSNALKTAQGR
jgi:hypothetical protein